MARSSTSFSPGTSGNPGGRKALPEDVVRLCRTVTVEAVEQMIAIMRIDAHGDAALLAVKARACEALLNRGWGTAPQMVTLRDDFTIRVVTPLTKGKPPAE